MPVITSKYNGTCTRCGGKYKKGDLINYVPKRVTHDSCYRPVVRYKATDESVLIRFDYDKSVVADVKELPNARWEAKTKTWVVSPCSQTDAFLDKYDAYVPENKQISFPVKIKLSDRTVVDGFPTLMHHQAQVVNTVVDGFNKLYVAIPPGGGKTALSLIAVEKTNDYPLLVVCPAIVKENWRRESLQWLNRDATILESRTPYSYNDDIVIINYDILDAWKDDLSGFNSIVFDEAHYLKSPSAKRTIASLGIARQAETLLYLSGSPVPSSPIDLAVPLTSLGVIDLFGGKDGYTKRYCPPFIDRWGNMSYSKTKNLPELHTNLKKCCFVSWKKEDILDLPPLREMDIPLDAGKGQFDDMIKSMKKATLAEARKVMASYDSLQLEQAFAKERKDTGLNKLSDIAEEAALLAEDEQVVVVVHHRDLNTKLCKKLKKFGVSQIIGGSKKQQAIDDFVSGKNKILVMSVTAGGIGINLQNASAMVIGELPATYAEYDQAISRIYRQGQSKGVMIYRMITPNSTDDILLKIVERKKKLHGAVMEGVESGNDGFKNALAEHLVDLKEKSLK